MGRKWGCQPFSYPCSQNVRNCRKEICSTCLSKESMPFVQSKPPVPSRSLRSLRAAARSTSSVSLHHGCKRSHLFVSASEKNMQRSKAFGHAVVVSKICYVQYSDCVRGLVYRILIVLSLVTCDSCKPMNHNEPLLRLSF